MIAANADRLKRDRTRAQIKRLDRLTLDQCRRLLRWLEMCQEAGRLAESGVWVMARLRDRVGRRVVA